MTDAGPTVPLDTIPSFDFDSISEAETGAWARLVPLGSNKTQHDEIELVKDEHTFGRLSTNDTKFLEPGISGKHCRIYRETFTTGKSPTTIVRVEDSRYARCNWHFGADSCSSR